VAEFSLGTRRGQHCAAPGHQPWNAPDRASLPPLRCSPRTYFPGWTAANGDALLHQFSLPGVQTGAERAARRFMIKVFENFDFSRVGQMQSLLESQGIKTFMRNQYSSSVVGDLPFVEVVPQLYVLEDNDLERAIELLRLDLPVEDAGEDWVCPECGIDVEGNFARCWKCGTTRD